jgi:asparagine synthase (glutamine-hydrolysing)
MCGMLHYSTIVDSRSRVASMTQALVHRGPDAEGYYDDPSISLGHRRLSIIDLSDAANQPFHDYTGRYVLVFNRLIIDTKDY